MPVLNNKLNKKERSGSLKRKKPWILPVLLIAGAVGVIYVLHLFKPEIEEEKHEVPPLVVQVSEATMDEELKSSYFQGEVRAKTDINLVTQVTGKVTYVSDKFIEGGQFDADEVILKVDDADYLVALKSATATVAEAQVQLDIELANAETSKKEWRDLYGETLENANPLRLNKPQVDRARARVEAAKAELAQAKLDLGRTQIRAPFGGRIQSKSAELGQFVSRGDSIGRIFSTDSVEIRIPMSDVQIEELGMGLGQIRAGEDKILARVKTRFGTSEHEWQGHLKSIDASVDNETRLLFGTVVVDNPFEIDAGHDIPLAPGLFVDVELDAAEKIVGVAVPRTALRSGDQIYIVKDGKIAFRTAKTLFTSPEVAVLNMEADNAVQAGDMIVVSPVPGAFDGMSVEVNGAKAAEKKAEEEAENEQIVSGASEDELSAAATN